MSKLYNVLNKIIDLVNNIPTAITNSLTAAKESGEFNGSDGVSVTHEWDGTVLSMTSASGTTSVDLKGEPGNSGVHFGTDEPKDDSSKVWIDLSSQGDVLDYVPSPDTATVGQTLVVKAVDESGKPIQWEVANLPSVDNVAQYRLITKIEIDETNQASGWIVNKDDDGNPFRLTHLVIDATIQQSDVASDGYLSLDKGKISKTFNLATETIRYILDIKIVGGVAIGRQIVTKPGVKYGGSVMNYHTTLGLSEITTMKYTTTHSDDYIPIGSTFHIYGY